MSLIILRHACICGEKNIIFSPLSDILCCPICNNPYEKINLVNDYEDLAEGFEARLQYLSESKNISAGAFKHIYGYDALNMKNRHGPVNLSLAKILDILQGFGCTPQEFRDLHINDNFKKISILHTKKVT